MDFVGRDDIICAAHPHRCYADDRVCPSWFPRCIFSWRLSSQLWDTTWHKVDEYLDGAHNTTVDSIVVGLYSEQSLGAMYWAAADGSRLNPQRNRVVQWPRSHEEVENGDYPEDTRVILDAWKAKIRSIVERGVTVYVIGPHPTYQDFENPCHDPPLPLPNATWLGERLICRLCAAKRILYASPDGRDSHTLPPNILDFVRPRLAAEYHRTTSFIADPLFDATREAGGIVLDPTSTLCLDGKCPFVRTNGRSTLVDSNHLHGDFVAQFGGFLDVTVGLDGGVPDASQYCV